MATNVTFEADNPLNKPGDGRTSKVSGVLSLADVVVNTTPNATGGWNTATVTADNQRSIYVGAADGILAGVPVGWYERQAGAVFKRVSG